MKKFSLQLMSLLLLASTFIFTSCGSEDDPLTGGNTASVSIEPDATYTTNDFEVGEVVSIKLTGNVPAGLSILELQIRIDGGNFQNLANPGNLTVGATAFEVPFTYTVDSPLTAGSTVTLRLRVVDADGTQYTDDYTVDVVAQGQGGGGGVAPLLRAEFTVNMGDEENTTDPSYLATATGTAYSATEAENASATVQQAIDITFGSPSGTNRLVSPDERENQGLNNRLGTNATATTFKSTTLGSAGFDAATSTDVNNDIDHSSGTTKAQNITAGEVYSFVNADGAKGYILVNSITASSGGQRANITVLVQDLAL